MNKATFCFSVAKAVQSNIACVAIPSRTIPSCRHQNEAMLVHLFGSGILRVLPVQHNPAVHRLIRASQSNAVLQGTGSYKVNPRTHRLGKSGVHIANLYLPPLVGAHNRLKSPGSREGTQGR